MDKKESPKEKKTQPQDKDAENKRDKKMKEAAPLKQEMQSGRGHRDDRAKNRSKNSQRFDHKMGSRGPFETFDI